MTKRTSNPRLAKIHRSYTVEEVARLYGVHRNTVRQWIRQGLATCDEQRPLLVLGSDLKAFLIQKRTRNKRPCHAGEVYCVRCRAPRAPVLGMADYRPVTATSGNLIGLCPECNGLIYRRVNLARLPSVQGNLKVRFPDVQERIGESAEPSVNSDFG